MNLDFNLNVNILKEGESFVAHSPALDLSTSGSSLEEAKKRFHEAVMMFFEELESSGNLSEVLSDLGWKISKTGEKLETIPPFVVSHDVESFRVPLHK